MFLGRAFIRSL